MVICDPRPRSGTGPRRAAGGRRGRVRTLVTLRRTGSRPPLFVVCAGHGDVLAVAHLAQLLDADQPCYALQAPLDLELTRHELLNALTGIYLRDIRSVATDGRVVLAGNSCGGFLALELAQRLCSIGTEPPLVVLLDTPCRITRGNYALHRLGTRLARYGSFADREQAPRWLRTLRAMWTDRGHDVHVRATTGYRPGRYAGPLVLFRADFWRLRGLAPQGVYVSAGHWSAMTGERLTTLDVPGHHWSFLREPRVRVLAQRLGSVLAAEEAKR